MAGAWTVVSKDKIMAGGASLGNVSAGAVTGKAVTVTTTSACRVAVIVKDENGNISTILSIDVAAN
jgi:hypothetical protein